MDQHDDDFSSSRRSLLKNGGAVIASGAVAGMAGLWQAGAHGVTPGATLPVRQDIDSMDPGKLAKVEAAIKEMKERSKKKATDPKGWTVVAKAHADFCAAPGPSGEKQVHFCWWFLPWHRAYLAVTERKIRELAGDATLALPYWNWSQNRRIPARFAKPGSSLADAVRFTPDRDLTDGEVDYFPFDPARAKLRVAALGATKYLAEKKAEIGSVFGGIARPNNLGAYGNSRLEGTPHGPIHNYVGGRNGSRGGDMSDFETAARDPIFFAHHGNLDRLWEIWRQDPAHRKTEPDTKDFRQHPFLFTWLDGKTIEVHAEETLDASKLGYAYDSLVVAGPPQVAAVESQEKKPRLPAIASARVKIPPAAGRGDGTPRKYSLRIDGIQAPADNVTATVYVKPASDTGDHPGIAIGTFSAVRTGGRIVFPDTTLKFELSQATALLRTSDIVVTVVPLALGAEDKRPHAPLRYKSITVEPDE